jgi:hypothetical protein
VIHLLTSLRAAEAARPVYNSTTRHILRLDSDEWSNCAPFTTFHNNIRPRTFVDENQELATPLGFRV